jgi:hypothetical protein
LGAIAGGGRPCPRRVLHERCGPHYTPGHAECCALRVTQCED